MNISMYGLQLSFFNQKQVLKLTDSNASSFLRLRLPALPLDTCGDYDSPS